MKKSIAKLSLFALFIATTSCMTAEKKAETDLNTQVKAQAPANTPEQIMQRAAQTFSNADGLTDVQKNKLATIYSHVYAESMSIRKEIGQSKSLLFATLATPNYKNSDITALKNKIVALDQKRLTLMFVALDDVQAVVGKGAAAQKIYKHFQEYEYPGQMRDYNFN